MNTQNTIKERPPIVAVMGHVDHGKSTLLDYIRKTNIVAGEAGGITQHISAYEINHINESGLSKKITFLDTPGHEAFGMMRRRGASIADIAILVVSAEDSIKTQTLESLKSIKEAGLPFIVAINKIDKPNANPEKVKTDFIEHEVYLEGFGGDVPYVHISAKAGTGVPELIATVLLLAEMIELRADPNVPATGFILESDVDQQRGISSTLIITDGTLSKGMFIVADNAISGTKIFEDFTGKQIVEATFSSPIRITGFTAPIRFAGFTKVPRAGEMFRSFQTKKEAEEYIDGIDLEKISSAQIPNESIVTGDTKLVPLIIKTDVLGTGEAIAGEIARFQTSEVAYKIISLGVGDISENDVLFANVDESVVIAGFNTKMDRKAIDANEQVHATIKTFNVIYELTKWLKNILEDRRPRKEIEEVSATVKVLKLFSQKKTSQVLGGKVQSGVLKVGTNVRIIRRENFLGYGTMKELQQNKIETKEVATDMQFGGMVDSKIDIAEGDILEAFTRIIK